jgi:protein-tyrosine phosphatase
MGGYPAAEGRKTRGDLLFRSEYFELKNKKDIDRFAALGINLAFDLRSPMEILNRPVKLARVPSQNIIELSIPTVDSESFLTNSNMEELGSGDIAEIIKTRYASMVIDSADIFCTFLRQLVTKEPPVLLFCSFGKDRTGIAAALVLATLGVPREVIREDYLLSARAYQDVAAAITRLEYLGLKNLASRGAVIEPILTVQSVYFDVFWESMEKKAGSFEEFMEGYLKISTADLKNLREKFTR